MVITDANGCVGTHLASVDEPDTMILSATATGEFNTADGSASVTAIGGTSPYTVLWSDGQTTQTATGLVAGTYTATVTDANGCVSIITVEVPDKTAIEELEFVLDNYIYPNPSAGVVNVGLLLDRVYEKVELDVINIVGQVVYSEVAENVASKESTIDLTNNDAGIYIIRWTVNGKTLTNKLIISK